MCQYCGCRDNTVIGRFMDEHEILINYFGSIREAIAAGDSARAATLCDEMNDLFARHAEDEETGIFAEMKRQDEVYVDKIDRLCLEHGSLHDDLNKIKAGDTGLLDAYEHVLRNHIDAEDNGLFPAANIELEGDAWERIDATLHENLHRRGEAHSH